MVLAFSYRLLVLVYLITEGQRTGCVAGRTWWRRPLTAEFTGRGAASALSGFTRPFKAAVFKCGIYIKQTEVCVLSPAVVKLQPLSYQHQKHAWK